MPVSPNVLPGVPLVESMLFDATVDQQGLTNFERDIAVQLNQKGFAVLDFPDSDLDERIERIKANLTPHYPFESWRANGWANNQGLRIQDAWRFNPDVRAIASNQAILDLLSKIYGRRAFPFQTLNFPVGTQQHYHSDSIHFSSIPERFMCGVWLAMEDISPDAGPLVYYPGSHKWPIMMNDMIGQYVGQRQGYDSQAPYEPVWEALVEASGIQPEIFCPKKGQALIWAANLLHGGSRQNDPELTRWSQVSHYYFHDCVYYSPGFSDPAVGNLELRDMTDVSTGRRVGNVYMSHPVSDVIGHRRPPNADAVVPEQAALIPADFDADRYYMLHPDVAVANVSAEFHYVTYGLHENRAYK